MDRSASGPMGGSYFLAFNVTCDQAFLSSLRREEKNKKALLFMRGIDIKGPKERG